MSDNKSDNEESGNTGKRPHDDDGESNESEEKFAKWSKPRAYTEGGKMMEVRMIIPVNTAGAIIGKGGTKISDLRQEFNARILLPDSDGYERVVTVTTSNLEDAAKFVGKAVELLQERVKAKGDGTARLLIHKSQAGNIIGLKGSRIKELRETTGARIIVNSECCPRSTDRVCKITGSSDVIVKCVTTILESLKKAPLKGLVQKYDPTFYDDSYDYGGFNSFDRDCPFDHPPRKRNREGGFNPSRGGRRFRDDFDDDGYNGQGFGGQPQRRGPPPFEDRPIRPRVATRLGGRPIKRGRAGYGGFDDDGYDGFDDGFGDEFSNGSCGSYSGPRKTTQVTIPTGLVGSIVGPGGQRIRQTRQDSGADIKIEEEIPGTKERIITIIGTQEQAQTAQYLLQKSVKLYSGEF